MAEARREAAGDGGAGREEVSDSRCDNLSDWVVGRSGMVTFGGGASCVWKVEGVGVAGGEPGWGSWMVGVASPSRCLAAPFVWSSDLRLVSMARMICSIGFAANSCAPSLGGGRNGDPGDGKGDEEVEWSTVTERWGISVGQKHAILSYCGLFGLLCARRLTTNGFLCNC